MCTVSGNILKTLKTSQQIYSMDGVTKEVWERNEAKNRLCIRRTLKPDFLMIPTFRPSF